MDNVKMNNHLRYCNSKTHSVIKGHNLKDTQLPSPILAVQYNLMNSPYFPHPVLIPVVFGNKFEISTDRKPELMSKDQATSECHDCLTVKKINSDDKYTKLDEAKNEKDRCIFDATKKMYNNVDLPCPKVIVNCNFLVTNHKFSKTKDSFYTSCEDILNIRRGSIKVFINFLTQQYPNHPNHYVIKRSIQQETIIPDEIIYFLMQFCKVNFCVHYYVKGKLLESLTYDYEDSVASIHLRFDKETQLYDTCNDDKIIIQIKDIFIQKTRIYLAKTRETIYYKYKAEFFRSFKRDLATINWLGFLISSSELLDSSLSFKHNTLMCELLYYMIINKSSGVVSINNRDVMIKLRESKSYCLYKFINNNNDYIFVNSLVEHTCSSHNKFTNVKRVHESGAQTNLTIKRHASSAVSIHNDIIM